jgi:hypothetical protein
MMPLAVLRQVSDRSAGGVQSLQAPPEHPSQVDVRGQLGRAASVRTATVQDPDGARRGIKRLRRFVRVLARTHAVPVAARLSREINLGGVGVDEALP